MGETWTSFGFADFDQYERGNIVAAKGAKIDFNSDWAMQEVNNILDQDPSALEYAYNARGGEVWDIKLKAPNNNVSFGSKLFGKHASARDAGNFAAGAVGANSFLTDNQLDYVFGTYNQSGNSVKNSVIKVVSDLLFSFFPDTQGMADYRINNTIKHGEHPLSMDGIKAGRNYIKNKK
ncbi:hypothetical protein [Gynurincola endophyticus]|uniref:hypothetical protein n=1 Tax=Gynurincola endophyticus TaxID=2479004 RepID=UPI000F8C91BD|nr:hypothetical protein [Gynurincola endophyticus]